MDLYDVIRDERDFQIMINEEIFFHEPLFPILELVQYCRQWIINANTNFAYNTIESEENPLLSFMLQKEKWRISSVWQKFECEVEFSFTEVKAFIRDIINQVVQE